MALHHILVIGRTDVGRRVCTLMQESDTRVTHLHEPSDAELGRALTGDVDGVAILLHDDIAALRYGLIVHHIRPTLRLFVAMFDLTARAQLRAAVPECVVLSPAAISVPAMVAAAIDPRASAIRRRDSSDVRSWVSITSAGHEGARIEAFTTPETIRTRGRIGRLLGQFRPFDTGSGVLLAGALGLIAVIIADTAVGLTHAGLLRSLYDATRTTATISAPELPDEPLILIWATIAALLVMAFTAMFAAGIVNYLLSGRHVALAGRRVAPRSGHVIVVGMGQVGLRLAQELRQLGVAVIGVEQSPHARSLQIARRCGIPVLIGDGASRALLNAARAPRALALVAAGSEDRDNIAVTVSALAVNPELRIVLRAGTDDAIKETQSLFHIGSVVDVNGLTASFVASSLGGTVPYAVIASERGDIAVDAAGEATGAWQPHATRCTCD